MVLWSASGLSAQPADAPAAGQAGPLIRQSAYARWSQSLPADYPQLSDYRRVHLRWVAGAEEHWTRDPGRGELGPCRMGAGNHVHVRTARALPAYAALAADAGNTDKVWTRERLVRRLNDAIAFLCATYDPAPKPAAGRWGKRPGRNSLRYETWIIGNMLDVVQMASDAVSADNRKRIRDILIDIAEDERTSGRALSLADYRHEGIVWTMNLLARGAILYRDHPQAGQWLDLAKHGYASAFSVPADLHDATVVDGKSVKEWVARRGGVFRSDFTLDHHSLGIHPGYMCMSSHRVGALYDLMKRSSIEPSPIWRHHFGDLMNVIKDLSLWDGRVAFPNAKDWADYLYGVSAVRYNMVSLQMMFADREARLIEQGLFRQLEWMQIKNRRGDFGLSNAEYLFNVNDMADTAFPYFLHQVHGFAQPAAQEELDRSHAKVHHSAEGKFVYVRDPRRFASWGWQACYSSKTRERRSTGLIIPRGHGLGDHLAQWDDNLIPAYSAATKGDKRAALHRRSAPPLVETFADGFAVSQRTDAGLAPGEGQKPPPPCVVDQRVMVALPDGRTVLVAAAGRAVRNVAKLRTNDLNWRFLRTVFCDNKRTILYEGGRQECENVKDVETGWLNVDDVLGVVPLGRPARATCTVRDDTATLSLCSLPARDYQAGQEVFTLGAAFVTDVDAAATKVLAATCREEILAPDARVYRIRGQDGKQYAVAVNFSDREIELSVAGGEPAAPLTPQAARVASKEDSGLRLHMVARGCAVICGQPK